MSFEAENKVKIRIKLRSGEEFEAEGSPAFIEKQRADFLQLIGKTGEKQKNKIRPALPENYTQNTSLSTPTPFPAAAEDTFVSPYLPETPAALRRPMTEPSPETPQNLTKQDFTIAQPHQSPAEPNLRLWEELCKTEEDMVVLRRKSRLLTPETAALLLIAGAKVLLQAENGFSALNLSKSLAKSGYGGSRLDRVLAGELKRGSIKSFGSKRSRLYSLSDEGFARAFVLAGKVIEEWR